MQTRMEKYYDENHENTLLRQQKNESLYENIGNYEVENDYKLDTNVTVLDHDAKNIDVEQIKKILDTKYNQAPKRRSIVIEEQPEEENISLAETREYDINAILEQAREEKEDNYEAERLKKVRDTQYDILNSLDLPDENEVISEESVTEETGKIEETKEIDETEENTELMDLINTITAMELDIKPKSEKKEMDPLDILADLKGSENTIVVGGAREEESTGETSPIMTLEEAELARTKALPVIKEKVEEEAKFEPTQSMTSTLQFTQSDFDDFNDLKKEVKSNRALIYTIVVLVGLVLVAGLVLLFTKFINLS